MNIDVTAVGNLNISKLNSENVIIELPITFTKINSGPRGINNVIIQKIVLDGKEILSVSNVSIHSYIINQTENTICGEMISVPVLLQSSNDENQNILVLKFEVTNEGNHFKVKKTNENSCFIQFFASFYFIHSRRLDLIIEGESKYTDQIGQVVINKVKRKEKATLTNVNLTVLIILILGLSIWNYYLNRNIYLQDKLFYEHEIITGVIATLVTFLGLSIKKLKSTLAVLTDFKAFFKYPEIHLSLSQFDGFSSKSWFFILIIITLGSTYLVYEYRSIPILIDGSVEVFDIDEKETLDLDNYTRIYTKTVESKKKKNKSRYILKLKNLTNKESFKWIEIGHIDTTSKKFTYYKYDVTYTRYNQINRLSDLSAIELIDKPEINGKMIPFEKIFLEKPLKINGLFVDYNLENNPKQIEISDRREINQEEVDSVIQKFNSQFIKKKPIDSINKNRRTLVVTLKNNFNNAFGDNGIIKRELLLEKTFQLISETNKGRNITKRTIERYIYLNALWQSSEDRVAGDDKQQLCSQDLEKICSSISETLSIDTSWKRDRSIMEFILEAQKQIGGETKSIVEFLDKNVLCNKQCGRTVNLLDFIVISVATGMENSKDLKDYVKSKLPSVMRLYIQNDTYSDYYQIIESREKNGYRKTDYIGDDPSVLRLVKSFLKNVS